MKVDVMDNHLSEDQLRAHLNRMKPSGRTAFAAACAQRLLPCYLAYCRKRHLEEDRKQKFVAALGCAWNKALEIQDKACANLSPSELIDDIPPEDDAWDAGEPYSVDAAVAVIHALSSAPDGDIEPAIWAARAVRDALFSFLASTIYEPKEAGNTDEVQKHQLMKCELMRQREDIDALSCASGDWQETVRRIRERATVDAEFVFSGLINERSS